MNEKLKVVMKYLSATIKKIKLRIFKKPIDKSKIA